MVKSFATTLEDTSIPSNYHHGFTDEEVLEIRNKFTELDARDKTKLPLTQAEQVIVIKMCRINRVTPFTLEKEKPVKAPKEPKVKPLTKAFIKKELKRIALAMAVGDISAEDKEFFEKHDEGVL